MLNNEPGPQQQEQPAAAAPAAADTTPQPGPGAHEVAGPQAPTPATGRQVYRNLRRQLTDEELATTGVQKLLLADLDRMDAECAELRDYEKQFHEKDKEVAVKDEKLRTNRAIDVCFGVGIGLGGIGCGLAPYFWDKLDNPVPGIILLALGLALVAGGAIVKLVKG